MPTPFVHAARAVFVALLLFSCGLCAQAPIALEVKGMPDGAPLAVTASHDATSLRIVADIKAGWHLYGRDVGGGTPVAVTITGGAFAASGALATPMDKDGLITCKAVLTLPLQRTGDGDALTAKMAFMVCDALMCLPPIELELRSDAAAPAAAPTGPFRVLLVAMDESERTNRIAQFLLARGFTPTVTTWAKVTAELCDANEVVIADSLTFMAQRGKGVKVEKFPKTKSPIVAVNFLGTQLLVANKIAMACGYI